MVAALTDNTNYRVTIQQGGASGSGLTGGSTVIANATAKLRLQIENKWENIIEALGLDSGIAGGFTTGVVTGTQLVTGSNYLPIWATSHVWRGSSGIEVTLEMRFDAWSDAAKDVIQPIANLVKMFSPTAGPNATLSGIIASIPGLSQFANNSNVNNFLAPPGPTPYDQYKGTASSKTITVQIGNALRVTNLIPVNLGWEFENRFVQTGNPICALVTASFMSFTLPTQADILAFFINGANNSIGH